MTGTIFYRRAATLEVAPPNVHDVLAYFHARRVFAVVNHPFHFYRGQVPLEQYLGLVSAAALAPLAPLADALALGAAERLDATGCRAFDYWWVRGAGSAARRCTGSRCSRPTR